MLKSGAHKWLPLLTFTNVFKASGTILLFIASYLSISSSKPDWYVLCTASIFLIMGSLDQIHKFKVSLGGIEGETREVTQRARDALQDIKKLSFIVANMSLSLAKRSKRLAPYTDAEIVNIKNEILNLVKKLGADESDIANILRDFHRFTCIDRFEYALYDRNRSMPRLEGGADDVLREFLEEFNALTQGCSDGSVPSPKMVKNFFSKYNMLTKEREDKIAVYHNYYENSYLENEGKVTP